MSVLARQQLRPEGGALTVRSGSVPLSATWEVPALGLSGSASVVQVQGGSVWTATLPGPLPVEEGIELRWSQEQRVTFFDVVLYPYGPLVTLADLIEERPDIGRTIEQVAAHLGVAAEQVGERIGQKARRALDDMIRGRLVEVREPLVSLEQALGRHRGQIYLRGYMILDQDRLRAPEVYLGLAELYQERATGDEVSGDPPRQLAAMYRRRAEEALASSGPIRVDAGDGRRGQTRVGRSGSVRLRREQG